MYRKTIEHPDYLPEEIRKRTDFDSGKTMGRIWRIVRDDARPEEVRRLRHADFGEKSSPQLCEELRNPDGWWRDTAHRLLLERRDRTAIGPLRVLALDSQAPAVAVVNALHLLDALEALSDDLVRHSLGHAAGPVREHALQLAEPRLAREPAWLANVLPLADDEDARVRFQAAITLGVSGGTIEPTAARAAPRAKDDAVAVALARIAARDGRDRWTRAAVLSSAAKRELALLTALRERPDPRALLPAELLGELGRLLGSYPKNTWPLAIASIMADRRQFAPEEQAALITGVAEAARGRLAPPASSDVLAALDGANGFGGSRAVGIRQLLETMKRTAARPGPTIERRITAVGLLAFASFDQAGETLLQLVHSQEPAALQAAAVRALASERDARVAPLLLAPAQFAAYPPSLREEILAVLIERPEHQIGLLDAIEKGWAPKSAIDAQRRRQLTQSRDPSVRRRAEKLFGTVAGDRAQVYESYKEVVTRKADPVRGRGVFRRECASCHRLDQEGYAVGPDLFGIRNQPKGAILLHLLVPDHEITPGFAAYVVATKDGRTLTGLISSETQSSLTLREPLGKEDTILRTEIDEIIAVKESLMPQGLEKTISRQDFADLLAYLKGE